MEPTEEVAAGQDPSPDALASASEAVDGEVVEQAAQLVVQRAVEIVRAEFRGPLPPPSMLEGYDRIHPGTAERILRMAELEQGHRHGIENKVVDSETSVTRRGQYFGLIVAIGGLLVALGLGIIGQEFAAAVVAAVDLVGLTSVFVVRAVVDRTSRPPDASHKGEGAPSN